MGERTNELENRSTKISSTAAFPFFFFFEMESHYVGWPQTQVKAQSGERVCVCVCVCIPYAGRDPDSMNENR
jgi:hypothetical protein